MSREEPGGGDAYAAGPALLRPALHDGGADEVQTFGARLELTGELVVSRCSPNVETLLGAPPTALLGRSLASALGAEIEASARSAGSLRPGAAEDLGRVRGAAPLRATLFAGAGGSVVELVPEDPSFDAVSAMQLLHAVSDLSASDATLEAVGERVVRGVRRLTGHDRVVLVRFERGAGGRVIAEARSDGLPPLPQGVGDARWCAPVDRICAVADVDAPSVTLCAGAGTSQADAPEVGLLRGPSPQQRARLRAAGGRAAISAVIVCDGRPWGALECHHRGPRAPTGAERSLLGALADMIGVRAARGEPAAPGVGRALSREQIHDVIEANLGEAVILFDLDGAVIHWNDGARRVLGWTADETIGRSLLTFFLPSAQEGVLRRFASVQAGAALDEEVEVIARDGTTRRVEARARRFTAPDGAPLGVCAIFRDVTERRRAEQALRESEARFRTLADTAPVLIWMSDTSGGCTYFNRPWLEFTGRSVDEELGDGWAAGVHPEDRAACVARYLEAFARREPFQMEYRLRRRDGEFRWLLDSGCPRYGVDGEFAGYIGSCVDLTEHRRSEAEGREAAQRLALAMEVGQFGVWDWDVPSGRIVWDERHAQLSGMTLAEFDGTRAGAVRRVHPEDLRVLEDAMARAFARGEPCPYSYRVTMPDGAIRWIAGRGLAIHDATGRTVRAIGIVHDDTERHAAEEALRANNRRYQLLTGAMHDAVAMVTRERGFAYVTPSVQRLLGYTAEEVMAGGDVAWVAPEDRAETLRALAEVSAGRPSRLECRVRHRDGHFVAIESTMTPWYDEAGQIIGVVSCARDISQRRAAEEALREANRGYEELVATVDGIVWEADAQTFQFLFVSQAAERMLGYPVEAWREKDFWLKHIHPEDGDAAEQSCRAALARGESHQFEYRMIARDGRVLWVQDTVAIVRSGPDARLLRGIMVDITERKRIEANERRISERFELAAESARIGVWDLDLVRGGLIWDDRMLRIYGLDRADCPTDIESWRRYIHPDDLPRLRANNAVLIEGRQQEEGASDVECRIVLPSGETRWIRSFAKMVRGPSGAPARLTGINIDITERKRSEERQREMELRLRQSQKLEAIGQLAGGVAHDFNNLLMVITLSVNHLLADGARGATELEALEAIREAGERGAALTRQLLAFGRKQVLKVAVVDLNHAVAHVAKMLGRLLGEDIECVVRLAPGLRPIRADVTQLDQILINLAVNARDAMPRGGRLTLETSMVVLEGPSPAQPEAQPGAYVRLSVADDGCGMDEATRARIFEPFFTTKEPGKGTGLGLATVYGLVRQFAGHITVDSAVGRGTTFTILFPAASPERSAPAGQSGQGLAGGTETILIVEDDVNVRKITTKLLERRGYRVLAAADVAQALRICEETTRPIALLITDVVMPGLGGTAVAEALRARIPGLKVIFISGYNDDMVLRHGIEHEKVPFLQKPFTADALARLVRATLDR